MRFLTMLFFKILILYFSIGACRVLSMTFKTFCRSITIKSNKLAAMFIAYKNTWGIATDAKKKKENVTVRGIFIYRFSPADFFPCI